MFTMTKEKEKKSAHMHHSLNATSLCEKLRAVKLRKGEIVKRGKDQRFSLKEESFSL